MPRKSPSRETIPRFDYSDDEAGIVEKRDGKYMLYDDHLNRIKYKWDHGLEKKINAMTDHIAALQQRIYELEAVKFCRNGKYNEAHTR